MPITLVAWYKSVDPAGAFGALNGVPDQHVTVSGTDILVPALSKLVAEAMCLDTTVAAQGYFTTPSLVADGYQEYVQPFASGLKFSADPEIKAHPGSPIDLTPVEALQAWVNSNPAAAVAHYGLAWLSDGPLSPVAGRMRTVRATGVASLSAGVWVNTALTFPVSLKAGRYAIAGLRVMGANLVAARLVIPGNPWRPGVPGAVTQSALDFPLFRFGQAGVWGEFVHASPPTLDCLGVTDTAQEVFLDLIYLGA